MNRYAKERRARQSKHRSKSGAQDETAEPTFSLLNARSGRWRKRSRWWLAKGIRGEVGRAANLLRLSDTIVQRGQMRGTSIFDPHLAEIVYRWTTNPGDMVIDPFAGGSTRGVVAGCMGRRYRGLDIRPEQIAANVEQHNAIVPSADVRWAVGDARDIRDHFAGVEADLLFTSPPFWRLERYSDHPRDLSNMDLQTFEQAFREIVARSCTLLRENRFAVVVIGEARRDDGYLAGLIPLTIDAFKAAGLFWYNNAVLATSCGSAAMRANRIFVHRKLTPVHQHVLVFVKGNALLAAAMCRQ